MLPILLFQWECGNSSLSPGLSFKFPVNVSIFFLNFLLMEERMTSVNSL